MLCSMLMGKVLGPAEQAALNKADPLGVCIGRPARLSVTLCKGVLAPGQDSVRHEFGKDTGLQKAREASEEATCLARSMHTR